MLLGFLLVIHDVLNDLPSVLAAIFDQAIQFGDGLVFSNCLRAAVKASSSSEFSLLACKSLGIRHGCPHGPHRSERGNDARSGTYNIVKTYWEKSKAWAMASAAT
jgi:hypothetical protein